MSLATRCGHCGTVFRVVQDQLKVSEGWVRCGRCGEVFNALEGLFDLEGSSGPMPLPRDTPAPEPVAVAPTPAPTPAPPPPPAAPKPPPLAAKAAPAVPEPDTQQDAQTTQQVDTEFETQAGAPDGDDDWNLDRTQRPSRRPEHELDLIDSVVPEDAVSVSRESEPSASFLREAERVEQWQRPRVRRSLWLLSSLLALVLMAQVIVHRRDTLAARWPESAPALSSLCGLLGCTIEAPRALDVLAVESSGLTRVEGAALYRLQVALRNRGATRVLAPALDVTLTDSRGDVVARRVLRAVDLGTPGMTQLASGGEWPINAVLDLGGARVTGYTVELFYP